MDFPDIKDIETAMRNFHCYKAKELIGGDVDRIGKKIPKYSGGCAVVFPFTNNARKKVAVRCWFNDKGNAITRSSIISDYLKKNGNNYFVDFEYIDNAIEIPTGRVQGTYQPIVIMEWVNGKNLKEYINEKNDSNSIFQLAEKFKLMVIELHRKCIAHGDLQHNNIMVKNNGELVLVDYDSMYVEPLKGNSSLITGLDGYQHPIRMQGKSILLNHKLDYFSELIIYLSLLIFAENPHLWKVYFGTEDLLFSKEDFANIEKSDIYKTYRHSGNTLIAHLMQKLKEALKKNDLNDLLPLEDLLEGRMPQPPPPPILITAISNNTNFGTVNVSGNVIIATPNPYYRISSPAYEITNGNAKVIKSGNTFTVTTSTDCEIRINFEKTKIPPQPPNITAIPNNSTLGTVYVSGYGIIAIPKNNKVRYAKCSYTIINGKASVVQNGNTFTVTASTDCEIRINFKKTIWQYLLLAAVVALCLSIGTFIIFFNGTEKGCNGIENCISSIDSLMLIGDYTAKYKIDGQSSGDIMNGYIEAISQNEYRITIYSDFDPVCFSFFYDEKTETISLSDFPQTELNQFHFGNYRQIQIIFKKDNQLWEFTKELAG